MSLEEFLKEYGNVPVTLTKPDQFSPNAQKKIGELAAKAIAQLGEPRRRLLEDPHEYEPRRQAYWAQYQKEMAEVDSALETA
jgi:hypothetical protein